MATCQINLKKCAKNYPFLRFLWTRMRILETDLFNLNLHFIWFDGALFLKIIFLSHKYTCYKPFKCLQLSYTRNKRDPFMCDYPLIHRIQWEIPRWYILKRVATYALHTFWRIRIVIHMGDRKRFIDTSPRDILRIPFIRWITILTYI